MHKIKDSCIDNTVPLTKVTSKILAKVIEYCKKHVESPNGEDDGKIEQEELKTWDTEFVKVDDDTLIDIVLAAKYLKINNLLDLTIQAVADTTKGIKTVEEIREAFKLKNDSPVRKSRRSRGGTSELSNNDLPLWLDDAWLSLKNLAGVAVFLYLFVDMVSLFSFIVITLFFSFLIYY
ncbi:hypothetical protein MKX03_012488 [Papaver bracteatum]|nr:hypothetical protein MKX03_012488 [Papaver bracteatum]